MIANLLTDHAFLIYLYTLIIALYSAVLFTLVWRKKGAASTVFIYVNLLLWGIVLNVGMLLYARYMVFTNIGFRDRLLFGWFWPLRMYVMAIAITAIAIHMTYRLITGKQGEHPFGINWQKLKEFFK